MIWLFASVVLLLVVFHAGFRKFALWFGGIAAGLAAITLAIVWWNQSHPKGTAAVDISDLPVPPPGTPGATTVGVTISCPPGQLPTKSNLTGEQSCYNSHDAAQLAQHLKECTHQPDEPAWLAKDKIVADTRNIPCNEFDKFDNDCPAPPATPWPGCVSRDSKPWTKYPKPSASKTAAKSGQLVPPEDLPDSPEFICPPGVPSTPGKCKAAK